jgi:hypothetical protein
MYRAGRIVFLSVAVLLISLAAFAQAPETAPPAAETAVPQQRKLPRLPRRLPPRRNPRSTPATRRGC